MRNKEFEQKILDLIKKKENYDTIINKVYEDTYSIFLVANFIELTETTIREFWDRAQHAFPPKKKLTIDFLREFEDKIDWNMLDSNIVFDFKIMKEFWDKIDWMTILYNEDMTEEEIDFYITHTLEEKQFSENWLAPLISHQRLTENILEKHYNIFKVYMSNICKWQMLSEDFIERHAEDVDWYMISAHQYLSEEFLRIHELELNWNAIHETRELSPEFVKEIYNTFMTNVRYNYVINRRVTTNFIKRYFNKFRWDWQMIVRYVDLTPDFIWEYATYLDFADIARFQQNLSEKFAEENLRKYISEYIDNHDVSIDFIRKHAEEIKPMFWLSIMQKKHFDESLIREFKDYVTYNLTDFEHTWDFIREIKDEIVWYPKLFRTKLTTKQIEEAKYKIDWESIPRYFELTEQFIEKYAEKWDWRYIFEYQHLSKEFKTKCKELIGM